jgi:hypothetical protein
LSPSQIFADTQRVDLFNDPKWETSPPTYPSRGAAKATDSRSRWAVMKAVLMRRAPQKRGRHSQNPA